MRHARLTGSVARGSVVRCTPKSRGHAAQLPAAGQGMFAMRGLSACAVCGMFTMFTPKGRGMLPDFRGTRTIRRVALIGIRCGWEMRQDHPSGLGACFPIFCGARITGAVRFLFEPICAAGGRGPWVRQRRLRQGGGSGALGAASEGAVGAVEGAAGRGAGGLGSGNGGCDKEGVGRIGCGRGGLIYLNYLY